MILSATGRFWSVGLAARDPVAGGCVGNDDRDDYHGTLENEPLTLYGCRLPQREAVWNRIWPDADEQTDIAQQNESESEHERQRVVVL